MKIIKKIFVVLILLLVGFLLLGLFIDNNYEVKREITVQYPEDKTFEYLKLFENHIKFNPWMSIDSTMTHEVKGTDGEVGSVFSWNGNLPEVGQGEQEIVGIIDSLKRIDYDIHFIKPREGFMETSFDVDYISDDETKVEWSIRSEMGYPSNLMTLFYDLETHIGVKLDEGLENIKKNLDVMDSIEDATNEEETAPQE